MSDQHSEQDIIKQLLTEAKTIAVVGLSDKTDRISYHVAAVMQSKGYKIIPVNPSVQGMILNEPVFASLADISTPVDIVNVFRRSEHTPEVAQEAADIGAKALWLQLGIANDEAARIASDHGLTVIMDKCIKVEAARL